MLRRFTLISVVAAAAVIVPLLLRVQPLRRDSEEVLKLGFRPAALADVTPVVATEVALPSQRLALKLVPVSSPPDGWSKFNTGEVDALAGMPLASIFDQLKGKGPNRKFIAYFLQVDLNGEGWVAIIGSGAQRVTSLSQLAGRTVATLNTDQAEWLMRRILRAAGIPEDRIKLVRYNPSTPLLGLRSGEHAAIFGLEPALAQAITEGNTVLARGPVSHYLYDDRPVPLSASIIAADWVSSHPGAFDQFVRVMDQAVAFTRDQPDRVRHFFQDPKYGGLSPDVASRLSMPVMMKPDASLKAVTEQYVSDMLAGGVLKDRIDLAPLFPAVEPPR